MTIVITADEQRENVRLWLDDLRSGKFKQGRNFLCLNGADCCLGVLAKRMVLKYPGAISVKGCQDFMRFDGMCRALTERIRKMIGLNTGLGGYIGGHLSRKNDDGVHFAEIADIIESRPPGLFAEPLVDVEIEVPDAVEVTK